MDYYLDGIFSSNWFHFYFILLFCGWWHASFNQETANGTSNKTTLLNYCINFNITIIVVFAKFTDRHCQDCDRVCTPQAISSFAHAAVPAVTR